MKIVNWIVARFYILFFFPPMRRLFLVRYPEVSDIVLRHSILHPESFHAFYSDIDSTFVLKEKADASRVIKAFEKFRKVFIMFDRPEFYTEREWQELGALKLTQEWNLVEICWNIRKINWCRHSLLERKDWYHGLKMKRAIQKAKEKILKRNSETGIYGLRDFHYLDSLIPASFETATLCYCSPYTENTGDQEIILEMNSVEYNFFDAMMPQNFLPEEMESNVVLMKHKKAVVSHELYLSRSALRVKLAFGEPIRSHEIWCSHLERNRKAIFVSLFRSGNAEPEIY